MTGKRLLHVVASPRAERSRSGAIADHLLAAMPGFAVETLDLFTADLPPFDGAVIDARYALINGEAVPAEAAADWARIEGLIAHFLSFDHWLISVPMWNFGIPYRLKHYVDCITQPGLAFRVGADGTVEGQARGTAILIAAGALDTTPGTPLADLDYQVRYLTAWLGFIGVSDVRTVRICPTYGPPEVVEAAMARAREEADTLVTGLHRP